MDRSQPDARSERGGRGGRIQPGAGTASTQAQAAAVVTSGPASALQPPPSSLRPTPSYASVAARASPPQTQSSRASTPPPSLSLTVDPSRTPSPVSRGTTEVVPGITLAELAARLNAVERATQLRLDAVEQATRATQSRLDSFERATDSRFNQIMEHFGKLQLEGKATDLEQQIVQLRAQVADQIAASEGKLQELKKENEALSEKNEGLSEKLSTLETKLHKIAGLVGRAESWFTRKDPAGDIVRLEEQVDTLTKAQKDADYIQRMLLHFVQGDFRRALHESALEYYEALPAYLKRLVDIKLAKDDEKAEVSVASGHWSRLVRQATVVRDEWVEWERAEKGRVLTPAQKEDRLDICIMDLLSHNRPLRSFFQKRGVETWAFMLWTASRMIKNRPHANFRHGQTHPNPSIETAVAVFRPFLRKFGTAEPDETTALTPFLSALSVVQVHPIGVPARPAFTSEGILESVAEEKLQVDLEELFSDARGAWVRDLD